MKKTLKRVLRVIILLVLIAAFFVIGYITYSEIQATKAKEYLMDKYDFNDWNIVAIYHTEYVYEKDTDCSKLLLKKCTDNKELYKKFTFFTLDGLKVHVTEYKNNIFEDDYKKKDS